MLRPLFLITAVTCTGLVASCSSTKRPQAVPGGPGTSISNPFPAGTYENFTADPSYPKTYNAWTNKEVLDRTNGSNAHLVISLAKQRGILMNGDEVAVDYPVSTGRKTHPTPAGEYKVLEKLVEKSSNVYGKIYDAEGKLVTSDADMRTDLIPEGGKFVGAPMSYWMRLTWDGIGHHIGVVPRYPASHACIRGPRTIMPMVFGKVKVGTPVTLQ
jgi:hypothetical protein